MSKIALHVITMNREDELARLLGVCQPYVDVIRVCDGGWGRGYTEKVCKSFNAEYYRRTWDDDYSAQDNILLDEAKGDEWILVMDDDEMPSDPLLEHLQELITGVDYDMVRIPSLDIIDNAMIESVDRYLARNEEGEFVQRFRKDWLFRYYPDMYMEGTPHRGPRKADDIDWVRHDTGYPYFHIKSSDSFIINDCIHAFINPEQQGYSDVQAKEMHKFCKKAGIKSSVDIIPFLKYGDIEKNFRSWMIDHLVDDAPIYSWFASRYMVYRPDELKDLNFSGLLTSNAMMRFLRIKSCYVPPNIRTMYIHPLLKQMLMKCGVYSVDDVRALIAHREPKREEPFTEIEHGDAIEIYESKMSSNKDEVIFVSAGVLDKPEFKIPVEDVLDREFRDDQQDDSEYWNQDNVVNNDSAKEFSLDYEYSMYEPNKQFCDQYSIPGAGTVLEFGCGGGRVLASWVGLNKNTDYSLRLIGIDHSEKAIEKARKRLPFIEFHVGFGDRCFTDIDAIYTNTCLQHNSDHKQKDIFNDLRSALKPKGILYLMNEMTFSQHDWPDHVVEPQHMSPWFADDRGSGGTAAWWIARICDAGFELLEYNESRYVFRKITGVE